MGRHGASFEGNEVMAELKIYTGPMHGGKTTKLLAALERYTYQNKRVRLFKPAIDNRFSLEQVVTHSGKSWDAIRVREARDILDNVKDAQVVVVDEQFMIPGSADALIYLLANNITCLVSTLQLSYEPKPFPEVAKLMPWATSIEVCPAVCARCDKDAFYTRRKSGGTEQIEIGGAEAYEPLCWDHYTELRNRILFADGL